MAVKADETLTLETEQSRWFLDRMRYADTHYEPTPERKPDMQAVLEKIEVRRRKRQN
ncbi:MAG: hypothetical protein J6A23_05005 [Thermoguttaceae bacterium]|nr:hypothetical protein [Thermoguttaceae bacterium]MBP3694956.1 hypothetical protein [Thermoguttaceae bacterium]